MNKNYRKYGWRISTPEDMIEHSRRLYFEIFAEQERRLREAGRNPVVKEVNSSENIDDRPF